MTAKQKLALIAAQYVAHARDMTRSGDLMASVAASVDESKAKQIVEALEREGLVDGEGLLASGSEIAKVLGGVN